MWKTRSYSLFQKLISILKAKLPNYSKLFAVQSVDTFLHQNIYMQFAYNHNGQIFQIYFTTKSLQYQEKKGSHDFLI